MRPIRTCLATLALVLATTPASADDRFLPPLIPWDGASQALVVEDDHPWITPSERTGLTATPSYDETVAWLRRLVEAAPELEMVSLGDSPQGRPIWMVIASTEGAFTPEALLASDRARVLAHSGIHSGEIDGKDAGLMLLRDMTVVGSKRELLDDANFLFVPIFSVDGHERSSRYNRINQRGPEEMGWRTNARNLNLNRDYTKLDTVEMRHMIAALRRYRPDLYLDLHVTDGADYQYDITYGYNGSHAWSPSIATWLAEELEPRVDAALEEMGHIPGPLIFSANRRDMKGGMWGWTAGARFSNGYGDAIHLPTILLENHSLKPYDQRVLGTYVFLESCLRVAAEHRDSLRAAVSTDRAARPAEVPLAFQVPQDSPPPTIEFRAVASRDEMSEISGQEEVRWLGEPETQEIPLLAATQASVTATRPQSYLVPAEWAELIRILDLHGVEMRRVEEWETHTCERIRLPEASMAPDPYEGRGLVTPGPLVRESGELRLAPGSVEVSTDQPLGELAMILLEPESPDSFLQWGFLLSILSRTEYFETYAMEPMARQMLQDDPSLAEQFEAALEDEEFAADPRRRLEWFYGRSPWLDTQYKLYPIGRVVE